MTTYIPLFTSVVLGTLVMTEASWADDRSPGDIYSAFMEDVNKSDYTDACALLSDKARALIFHALLTASEQRGASDQQLAEIERSMSPCDAFVGLVKPAPAMRSTIATVDIDGDAAILSVVVNAVNADNDKRALKVGLVRENGEWRMENARLDCPFYSLA
jgi:hypothetical protein